MLEPYQNDIVCQKKFSEQKLYRQRKKL